MAYTFYIKDDHGFVPLSILAEECAIVERNGNPEVVERTTKYLNSHFNPWLLTPSDSPKYRIYVPKGTIVRNFSLDSKF